MTDYVKTTDFAAKDALLSGNPAKIVYGTEIDTEFNSIATAVATKLNIADAPSGGASWTTITSNTNAVAGTNYYCDTSGGAFTLTLPASPTANDAITATAGPTASTYNLTIARNGKTIMALSENLIVSDPNVTVTLVYNSNNWSIA